MTAMHIPKITDAQLAERSASLTLLHEKRVYEVVNANTFVERRVGLWVLSMPGVKDMRGSFTWNPTYVRAVLPGEFVAAKTMRTLHAFDQPILFKPSLAEVFAQAPDDLHEYAALSLAGPETAEDINREPAARRAGYHVAEVTYYRKAPTR